MYQNSTINLVYEKIHLKSETISESLIVSRPDLVQSDNLSNVLITTHNLYGIEDIFDLAIYSFQFIIENPFSKLIIVTPSKGYHFSILSRFRHIDIVLNVNRLSEINEIIKTFKITKLLYSGDLVNRFHNKNIIYPPIKMMSKDVYEVYKLNLYSHNFDILLISSYIDTLKDSNNVREIINYNKAPKVSLSNTFIDDLNCPQITHDGYLMQSIPYTNNCIDLTLSIAIGLLRLCPYISLTPRKTNMFDIFKKCLINTSN